MTKVKCTLLEHQTRSNHLIHAVGIPFILIGLLGFLGHFPFFTFQGIGAYADLFRIDAGSVFMVLVLSFCLYLNWRIAVPFAWIATGFYFLGRSLPVSLDGGLFILGWILQIIGHRIFEKHSPP